MLFFMETWSTSEYLVRFTDCKKLLTNIHLLHHDCRNEELFWNVLVWKDFPSERREKKNLCFSHSSVTDYNGGDLIITLWCCCCCFVHIFVFLALCVSAAVDDVTSWRSDVNRVQDGPQHLPERSANRKKYLTICSISYSKNKFVNNNYYYRELFISNLFLTRFFFHCQFCDWTWFQKWTVTL